MKFIGAVSLALSLIPAAVLAQPKPQATGNPMWSSGYRWQCETSGRMICERDGTCNKSGEAGQFILDYENNRIEFDGNPVRIKRHYQTRVANSPLQNEVKVELSDNRVLWLTAVDGSNTYSNAWVGSLIEPKGGVVLMINQSAFCLPKK